MRKLGHLVLICGLLTTGILVVGGMETTIEREIHTQDAQGRPLTKVYITAIEDFGMTEMLEEILNRTKPGSVKPKYKSIGEFGRVYGFELRDYEGSPQIKSDYISCVKEEGCAVSQAANYSQTAYFPEGYDLGFNPAKFLEALSLTYDLNSVSNQLNASTSGFELKPFSRGRLVFTPKLREITGRLERPGNSFRRISLIVPAKKSGKPNELDGTWSVEYANHLRLGFL